jgi:hypothetical protein
MTTLNEALNDIASALNVKGSNLAKFATEDTVGGYHAIRTLSKWPMGSLYGVEGQFLYALTRALQPDLVMEVGTWRGCSASHFLSALARSNKGYLLSVDIKMHEEGIDIPADAENRWRFVEEDAVTFIVRERPAPQIIFEDASHDLVDTIGILMAIKEYTKPKLLIGHDARHFAVGKDIRQAWDVVFGKGQYETTLIEPSDCGFAWKVFQ